MWGNCEVFGYSWSVARTVGFAGRGPWEDERDSVVKQARAELTRQQIVAGAAAQFEKTGYGSTSMADIVSGAGTTKGALYFHFASKDELAQFIIAEQHRLSIESVQAISATGKDPLEQMIMLTHEMARQIVDEPIVRAGIRLTLELSTYEGPVEPYAEWISAITDLTARAQAEGEIRKSVSAESFGRFMPSAFTGVQLVSNVLTRRSDLPDRWSTRCGRSCFRGSSATNFPVTSSASSSRGGLRRRRSLRDMAVTRIVSDLSSSSLEAAQRFYTEVLGLEVVMDHGWIVTLASPTESVIADQRHDARRSCARKYRTSPSRWMISTRRTRPRCSAATPSSIPSPRSRGGSAGSSLADPRRPRDQHPQPPTRAMMASRPGGLTYLEVGATSGVLPRRLSPRSRERDGRIRTGGFRGCRSNRRELGNAPRSRSGRTDGSPGPPWRVRMRLSDSVR